LISQSRGLGDVYKRQIVLDKNFEFLSVLKNVGNRFIAFLSMFLLLAIMTYFLNY
jgi:hypothetical protein